MKIPSNIFWRGNHHFGINAAKNFGHLDYRISRCLYPLSIHPIVKRTLRQPDYCRFRALCYDTRLVLEEFT